MRRFSSNNFFSSQHITNKQYILVYYMLSKQKSYSLHKFKSNLLLPVISQSKEIQKMYAKELSYNIAKFQTISNNEKDESTMRLALKVIKNFSDVQNNFSEVFKGLYRVLLQALFLRQETLLEKYSLKEGISYRQGCKLIQKDCNHTISLRNQFIRSQQKEIIVLKQTNDQQKQKFAQTNRQLQIQLQRYKQMANPIYVTSLENKILMFKNQIRDLEADYHKLARQNQQITYEKERSNERINQLTNQITQLNQKLDVLERLKQKTELYLLNTKDRFDQLMSKMIGIRQIISKVQHQNQILVSERVKLVNRAAVAFDDLTPRPKYQKKFNFAGKWKSTVNIFQELTKQITFQQIRERIIQKKGEGILAEAQKIRSKIVKDIQSSKELVHQIIKYSSQEKSNWTSSQR